MIRRLMQRRGFSFIELLVVTTIILVLAGAVMPLARVTIQRQKEIELRRALREIRTAIDKYKDAVDQGQIGGTDNQLGSEGYPPDLETLVEGVTAAGDASARKLKFLRRIPIDPMTGKREWGMRSCKQDPDSMSWDHLHVFDVHTLSQGVDLDGTPYSMW